MKISFSSSVLSVLALASKSVNGFFVLPCGDPITVERLDPIVAPGEVSAHEHTIMGGNGFKADMDYNDATQSTCSSCRVANDLSNYWTPTLWYVSQDGAMSPVEQVNTLVYYLPRSDSRDPDYADGVLAFPEGFRMVAGQATRTTFDPNSPADLAVSFVCLGPNGQIGEEGHQIPPHNCPWGLRTQIFFPSCWNGVDLDPPDHRSHMAYPSNVDSGYCPESHPKRVVSLFYEIFWDVDDFANQWWAGPNGDGHPFVLSVGDTTGNGFHGDFLNGWDVDVLQQAINTCDDGRVDIEDCAPFSLFSNEESDNCKIYKTTSDPNRLSVDSLPGCNFVTGQEDSSCTDNAVLTDPQENSDPNEGGADTTGWEYFGCAIDAFDRTLDGDSYTDNNGMTVESCLAFCEGYEFAGLEYYHECHCGNDIPEDRMPSSSTSDDCSLPCSGNSNQVCGGGFRLSTYRVSLSSGSTTPPTTSSPTTLSPSTAAPTTASPTSGSPTTSPPGTGSPTTLSPTTQSPSASTAAPTTATNPPTAPPTDEPTPLPTPPPSYSPTDQPTDPAEVEGQITGFRLINVETNEPIVDPLPFDAILDLAELPPPSLMNVQAIAIGTVSGVTFGYDEDSSFRSESAAPYALCGDAGGDYFDCPDSVFSVGPHTITGTPNNVGSDGAFTIEFDVINSLG